MNQEHKDLWQEIQEIAEMNQQQEKEPKQNPKEAFHEVLGEIFAQILLVASTASQISQSKANIAEEIVKKAQEKYMTISNRIEAINIEEVASSKEAFNKSVDEQILDEMAELSVSYFDILMGETN